MNSKIMFVWGLIIVLICSTLIIMGNDLKDKTLVRLERDLIKSTKEYFFEEDTSQIAINECKVVTVDELIEKNYFKKNVNIDKYCIKSIKMIKKLFINKYVVTKECKTEMKKNDE